MQKTPQRFLDTLKDPSMSDQDTAAWVLGHTFSVNDRAAVINLLAVAEKLETLKVYLHMHASDVAGNPSRVAAEMAQAMYQIKNREKRALFINFLPSIYDAKNVDMMDATVSLFTVHSTYSILRLKLSDKDYNRLREEAGTLYDLLRNKSKTFGDFNFVSQQNIAMASAELVDQGLPELFLEIKKRKWDTHLRTHIDKVSLKFLEYYFLQSSDRDKKKIIKAAKIHQIDLPVFSVYLSKKELSDTLLWAGAQKEKAPGRKI